MARLNGLLLKRLQDETDPERRAQIFAFPSQLAQLAEPLHETIGEIAAASRFDPPPRLRGLYLASAEQDGAVLDLVSRTASRHFALDLPRFGPAGAGSHHSFFLARLFRDVIFNEAALVSANPAATRRRLLGRVAAGLAAALVLGLTLVWLAAYLRQESRLADTDARLARYTALAAALPVEAVADADFVRADAVLSGARDAASAYTGDHTPRLLDAFDQEAKVTAGQGNLYERALNGYLLPRLLVALGTDLRRGEAGGGKTEAKLDERAGEKPGGTAGDKMAPEARAAALTVLSEPAARRKKPQVRPGEDALEAAPPAPPNLQETLRLYLMLGGEQSLDRSFAAERLAGLLARLYPEEDKAPLRASLDGHVAALLARPLVPIDLDADLVERSRGRAQLRDLAGRWAEAGGARACRAATERRYPFDRAAATETGLSDFTALFGPEGRFAGFFRDHLAGAVDTEAKPWRWRDGEGDPALLRSFEAADEIRRAFFQDGDERPAVRFEVTPLRLDAEASAASLISDGQEVAYTRGSARPLRLTWPGQAQGAPGPAARVTVQPGPSDAVSFTGPWALFRLVDAGRAEPAGGDRVRLAYRAGGREASFELHSLARPSPFALDRLRTFRCPRFP